MDETNTNEAKIICFSCGKEIGNCCLAGEPPDCPDQATFWESTGNYGSGMWDHPENDDTMHRKALRIYVCDACLSSKISLVRHIETRRRWERKVSFPLAGELGNI